MEMNKSVGLLAEEIIMRGDWDADSAFEKVRGNQFVLFIGSDVARAAGTGVPDMAYETFRDLVKRGSSMAERHLSEENLALIQEGQEPDWVNLESAFYDLLSDMSSMERYNLLQGFFTGIPVPRFYQDLARLIHDGYFSHVLTTTIDTLLEQALSGLGLQKGVDYVVINLGADPRRKARPHLSSEFDDVITIVKLHGDLTQGRVAVTPEEIEDVLKAQYRFVKGELSGDMVVVGYDFESDPVNRWLAHTPGNLWWVQCLRPDPNSADIRKIEEVREVKYIDGASADPETFFGLLATTLSIYMSEIQKGITVESDVWPEDEPPVAKGVILESLALPDDEEWEVQYLQDQLRGSQTVLYNVKQQAVISSGSVQAQTQIDYQEDQIARIVQDLRKISSTSPRVVELMGQIAASAESADPESRVSSFLQNQFDAVKNEYEQEQANQTIVEAAIVGTVLLGKTLGADSIDEQAVEELAAFAPGMMGGGV
jgi:hypothetical protein